MDEFEWGKNNDFIKLAKLKKFFVIEQNQCFDDKHLREIIKTHEDPTINKNNQNNDQISLSGFKNILFSFSNQIFDINKLQIYQVNILFL